MMHECLYLVEFFSAKIITMLYGMVYSWLGFCKLFNFLFLSVNSGIKFNCTVEWLLYRLEILAAVVIAINCTVEWLLYRLESLVALC